MGWWSAGDGDERLGDGPLDVLSDAVEEIVHQYRRAWQRPPRKAEWAAMLKAVLGNEERHLTTDGPVSSVMIDPPSEGD
jgi:hypothetical protein